jgi:transcriptional regulator of acetoin/glycerol metabolism
VIGAPEVAAALAEPISASSLTSASPAQSEEVRRLFLVLEQHRWNHQKAAAALGISRTTLWRKLRQHHLE